MIDTLEQTPQWAKTAQRPRGGLGRPVLPWDSLNTAWKAREAAGAATMAAAFMSGLNVFWAVMPLQSAPLIIEFLPVRGALLTAGAILAAIALRLHRTHQASLAWLVLAWSVADASGISLALYGHPAMIRFSPIIVLVAAFGLRGAMRLRRFELHHPT